MQRILSSFILGCSLLALNVQAYPGQNSEDSRELPHFSTHPDFKEAEDAYRSKSEDKLTGSNRFAPKSLMADSEDPKAILVLLGSTGPSVRDRIFKLLTPGDIHNVANTACGMYIPTLRYLMQDDPRRLQEKPWEWEGAPEVGSIGNYLYNAAMWGAMASEEAFYRNPLDRDERKREEIVTFTEKKSFMERSERAESYSSRFGANAPSFYTLRTTRYGNKHSGEYQAHLHMFTKDTQYAFTTEHYFFFPSGDGKEAVHNPKGRYALFVHDINYLKGLHVDERTSEADDNLELLGKQAVTVDYYFAARSCQNAGRTKAAQKHIEKLKLLIIEPLKADDYNKFTVKHFRMVNTYLEQEFGALEAYKFFELCGWKPDTGLLMTTIPPHSKILDEAKSIRSMVNALVIVSDPEGTPNIAFQQLETLISKYPFKVDDLDTYVKFYNDRLMHGNLPDDLVSKEQISKINLMRFQRKGFRAFTMEDLDKLREMNPDFLTQIVQSQEAGSSS